MACFYVLIREPDKVENCPFYRPNGVSPTNSYKFSKPISESRAITPWERDILLRSHYIPFKPQTGYLIIKVGATNRNGNDRAQEMSKSGSRYTSFIIHNVENIDIAEFYESEIKHLLFRWKKAVGEASFCVPQNFLLEVIRKINSNRVECVNINKIMNAFMSVGKKYNLHIDN